MSVHLGGASIQAHGCEQSKPLVSLMGLQYRPAEDSINKGL